LNEPGEWNFRAQPQRHSRAVLGRNAPQGAGSDGSKLAAVALTPGVAALVAWGGEAVVTADDSSAKSYPPGVTDGRRVHASGLGPANLGGLYRR
jgi:hypothetical protein